MKKILLINTSDVGAKSSAEAIKKLGFEPVFLINVKDFLGDTLSQVKQYTYYHVDCFDVASLIDCLSVNKIQDVEGVMSTLDSGICVAIQLGEALGVRVMPSVLTKLDNKSYVADLVPEYSPKSVTFSKEGYTFNIVKEMLACCNSKLLLKPTSAAGGNGVFVISENTSESEVSSHLSAFKYESWIIMAYISGELFSVEGFLENGNIHFLGVTSRKKVGNTETRMSFPFNDFAYEEPVKQAQKAVSTLAQRSGYISGYFHTEFMLEDKKCFLIDANFGRIGGGPLVDMIAESYGISSRDIFAHLIGLTLFPGVNSVSPFFGKFSEDVYGINYGIKNSGILKSIKFDESINVIHTILLEDGSNVPPMGQDNWAWIGMVAGKKKQVEKFMDSLQVNTTDGVMDPCY